MACAFARESDILPLDKPTTGLDVSVQAEILNLLTDLRKKRDLIYLMLFLDLPVLSACATVWPL